MPNVQLSVHTWNQMRMIMNKKLLTHKPTHRVALRDEGINSVMGFKKKKRHREHKLLNTIFCPFQSFHTEIWCDCQADECFCVVFYQSQPRDGDGCGSRKRWRSTGLSGFPVTKSFFSHDQQLSAVATVTYQKPAVTSSFSFPPVTSKRRRDRWVLDLDKLWLMDQNKFKFPTQTGSFSNPELVQVLQWDCSVCDA